MVSGLASSKGQPMPDPNMTPRPYVPMTEDEVRARASEVARGFDKIAAMGDEAEQAETLAFLEQALGPDRVISDRPLF